MSSTVIESILDRVPLPRLVRLRQDLPRPQLQDVAGDLRARLQVSTLGDSLRPGSSVAVGVGSRGVANLALVVRTVVEWLRELGAQPFIFPAMGSHGGATGPGQARMLAHLGVTEETCGAPVRSSMEVKQIGTADNGLPVYCDTHCLAADATILINRVKPHVGFRGTYESGIFKMLAIGLGKQRGAETCHNLGFAKMADNITSLARAALQCGNVIGAVALVENAFHDTCRVEVLPAARIEREEPGLLAEAKQLSKKLPFPTVDVLVIDEIGKNISGTGFDTNVVGRYHTPYAAADDNRVVTRLVCLDITEASGGNGNGLGIADFTTRRAFGKFKFEQTYPNSLTSTVPVSVKIPMVLDNDRQALQAAVKTCNIGDWSQVRFVRIRNTNEVDRFDVSETLARETLGLPGISQEGEPFALSFDQDGNLF